MDNTKLRGIREKKKLTQTQVAERAGISQQAYARIETGERTDPIFSTAERIADALGVKLDDLRLRMK